MLLPIVATALLAWLELFGAKDESVPLAWLIYPLPIIVWLMVGLLVQNLSLQKKVDLDHIPDISLQEAFQHVMLYSKWALGKSPDDDDYYISIESEIRDKARLGLLRVWARPIQEMSGGFRQTQSEVRPEKWDHYRVDIPSCVYDPEPSALIMDYTNRKWLRLDDAMANRQQVLKLWPKANWWERERDPEYVHRSKYFEEEKKGPRRSYAVPHRELE